MLNSKVLVYQTMYASIIIQILTSVISLHGFFVKLDPSDQILKGVLGIETFVQFVETFTYLWIIMTIHNINKMTPRRYFDWAITTPIMLISTIIYMDYISDKETNGTTNKTLMGFYDENKYDILKLFVYNGLMLTFGYLGERGIISKQIGIPIGFVFFFLSFHLIYTKYAYKSQSGKNLFYFVFICWFMYGIAAMFDPIRKNISYNMLDIVAKNFYGLFIYYKILQLRV